MKRLAWLVAVPVGLLTLGTLAAVIWHARGFGMAPSDWAAVRFTLLQSALSTGLSLLLALPVARALARRRFRGRDALISLMGAPFLLPVVVAVLGLLALFGRAGLINTGLLALGLPRVSVYGLQGVILAHVFLNLPLAVRMLLHGWQAIPAERLRLASTLGLPPGAIFRHLELPMLRAVLPGAGLVIFLLCLGSFAVALTLGGGPAATTVKLAIYQALRFDFDPGRAAGLAVVQFALCAGAVALAAQVALPAGSGPGLDRTWNDTPGGWRRGGDAVAIAAAAAFLLMPLMLVVARGLPAMAAMPPEVWPAAARSVTIALTSTALAVAAGLALALAVARGARGIETLAMLPLAASGLVMGTGLFVLLQPVIDPGRLALPVTTLVNVAMALPFVYRLLLPEAVALQADYGRLMQALALRGWARLRWVTLPRLSRPLGFAAGVAAALSMGDLGVIALFAGDRGVTLPLLVQRLAGAYRIEAAASVALVLVGISFALFWLFDRGGRRAAA